MKEIAVPIDVNQTAGTFQPSTIQTNYPVGSPLSTGKTIFSGKMSGNESANSMTVVSRQFSPRDVIGGHPTLDLVNTVTARNTATPIDWLDGYERILEWARLAKITEDKVLTLLGKQAAHSLESAARAHSPEAIPRSAAYGLCRPIVGNTRAASGTR
jgi:hypothetical protein